MIMYSSIRSSFFERATALYELLLLLNKQGTFKNKIPFRVSIPCDNNRRNYYSVPLREKHSHVLHTHNTFSVIYV